MQPLLYYITPIKWHEIQHIRFSVPKYISVERSSLSPPYFSAFIMENFQHIQRYSSIINLHGFITQLQQLPTHGQSGFIYIFTCYFPPLSYFKTICRHHILSVNMFDVSLEQKISFYIHNYKFLLLSHTSLRFLLNQNPKKGIIFNLLIHL